MFLQLQLILVLFASSVKSINTYKAAVVEYAPQKHVTDKPSEIMQNNVREYINLIEQAGKQKVDIIVFPEDAVTTIDVGVLIQDQLGEYSLSIPDPSERVSPCNGSYDMILKNLSCSAINNNMYVVVNLIDRKSDNATGIHYYNTNIVFDRKGTIVAKYYKINLYGEFGFTPGNQISTFITDFNVTFGMFICFDILFQNPSITTLKNPQVTDVVYSAAWFSETPYLTALSTQAGYARALGVNLLASGYNSPNEKNGGSGIYLANGSIAEGYISGYNGTKLIINDVPILSKRTPPENCSESSFNNDFVVWENTVDLNTSSEIFENYTLEPLSSDLRTVKEVCSLDFCCHFNVTLLDGKYNYDNSFEYLLAVFHGVRRLGTSTAGIRTCGIIACQSKDVNTCGIRNTNMSSIPFSSISISGKFPSSSDISDRPATLNTNLIPVNKFTFCREAMKDGKTEIKMFSSEQDIILSFGFYGRMFELDGKPVGVYRVDEVSGADHSLTVFVAVIVALVLAAVLIAYFIYKKSQKYQFEEI